MARPPLPVGTAGSVSVTEVGPKRFRARCRFRDHAGRVHHIERTGASRTAARTALTEEIRSRQGLRVTAIKPHHRVDVVIALYAETVTRRVATGEIAATTGDRYRHALTYLTPRIGALRVSEVGIGALEHAFAELTDLGLSANTRRLVRAVATQVFDLCLRHGAVASNPVRHISRITDRRRKAPRALTTQQRRELFAWLDGDESPIQRRARRFDLPDIVRFMIGTGARLGEALAVTWADVDLDGTPVTLPDGSRIELPTVRINGNVVRVRGVGIARHEGKTAQSVRTIPLPRFVAFMLRTRSLLDHAIDEPVFPQVNAAGTALVWRDPNKVMSVLRDVRAELGWPWLTTHVFRKTAATILHEAGISERGIGEHIGHVDRATLMNVYLGSADVDPRLVAALDAAVVGP